MAAATVLRLQTVVSPEVAGGETVVVTVGAGNAGTKPNIIPDRAELLLNVRSYNPDVRTRVLHAIERIVAAEAQPVRAPKSAGSKRSSRRACGNDTAACERTRPALEWVVVRGVSWTRLTAPSGRSLHRLGVPPGVPPVNRKSP